MIWLKPFFTMIRFLQIVHVERAVETLGQHSGVGQHVPNLGLNQDSGRVSEGPHLLYLLSVDTLSSKDVGFTIETMVEPWK